MLKIRKYSIDKKTEWDNLVSHSDNSFFFFKRDFLEYHQKPLVDFSVMIYQDNKLKAIMPINIIDHIAYSHQGITYGGLITESRCFYSDYVIYLNKILEFLKNNKVIHLVVSPQPSAYFKTQSNKLDLIIQRNQIKMDKCSVGAILNQQNFRLPTKRKLNIKSSLLENYEFSTTTDLSIYWDLVEKFYHQRFGFNPVHNFNEIKYLHDTFKGNINITSLKDIKSNKTVAGLMIFEDEKIAKIQYIAYEETAQNLINLLYYETLDYYIKRGKSIDWGSSMDIKDGEVKTSILWLKEKFGASPTAMNTVTFDLNQLKM